MARPNKNQAAVIKKRNQVIYNMDKKGYPLDYIAFFFTLTKGRVVQIIQSEQKLRKKISRTDRNRK